ncbi:glycerol-3-phosphate dehydrogenase (NAD(P)+) [Sorangium cellulosum]|uniref:Glycerol-3-phosphate dehydrogenase (NAD(P)+) n=1 Tax=Sorangium cellulosum TaxID=56 RepID=A0A4P2QBZ3_SORCE|nr:NAD(P)-binding domain-containing protein [Sorangium cellulosum]AUX26633.1 glycerol-3-phosphate dehydrogenase (NAD(P)+) [Sorangium cellulosum]
MSARAASSVGVIGGGFWGVALALAASRTGAEVVLFSRREHPELAGGLRVVRDYAEVARARLLVIAVPSNAARTALRALGDHMDGSHLVIHGVRGLEGEALKTLSDLVREETPARRVGALGGPVQADELTEGRPSAVVCGSRFPEVHAAVTAAFQSDALHVYTTPDIRGLEWASALVGCLAIGVGFAEQAGAGPGLLAALISRAVDGAARIAAAAGAEERTMLGLGGYGDLLASIRLESRPEVRLGKALARGRTLDEAVAEARLRVEAIPLIPRVVAFARERRVDGGVFEALEAMLRGGEPKAVLARMFAA